MNEQSVAAAEAIYKRAKGWLWHACLSAAVLVFVGLSAVEMIIGHRGPVLVGIVEFASAVLAANLVFSTAMVLMIIAAASALPAHEEHP